MRFKEYKSQVKELFSSFQISQMHRSGHLSLKDLKRLEKYVLEHIEKVKAINKDNEEIIKRNEIIKATNAERQREYRLYLNKFINPTNAEIRALETSLSKFRIGSFVPKFLFSGAIEWRGTHYRNTPEARGLIANIQGALVRLEDYERNNPHKDSRNFIADIKPLTEIPERRLMRINGVAYWVNLRLDAEIIRTFIDLELEKEKVKLQALADLKARAAENDSETRKVADSFKRRFPLARQLNRLSNCPYCNNSLNSDNAHLEHIYPVSKGGKSIIKNLIWVCATCNLKKGDRTLSSFIKTSKLERDLVETNLDWLEKDY